MMREVKMDIYKLGGELAGALNDTGLGDLKDASWFVEEFFYRLKNYYHGYDTTFDNAEIDTKELLDYRPLESTAKEEIKS